MLSGRGLAFVCRAKPTVVQSAALYYIPAQVSGCNMLTCNMKSCFTGKSLECGGSECREEATGRGVALCVRVTWSGLGSLNSGRERIAKFWIRPGSNF